MVHSPWIHIIGEDHIWAKKTLIGNGNATINRYTILDLHPIANNNTRVNKHTFT
jgi:hypothetical protein